MVSKLNEWIVKDYENLVRDQDAVVVVCMEPLTVQEDEEIRGRIREAGARLRITKNRLARVALKEVGIPIPDDAFDGTCGLLVGDVESAIAAAKAVDQLWKKADEAKVHFRAAYLEGSVMGPDEARLLPTMPDKDTVRAMMLSALLGPARQLASLMSEVPASLARGLQARADQEEAA